jgi:hypothetical protein
MNTEGLQQDCSAELSGLTETPPPWLGGWLETSKSSSSDVRNTQMSSFVIACWGGSSLYSVGRIRVLDAHNSIGD